MSKNILILNGATRKSGSTVKLIQAFSDGACGAGHQVQEFYLDNMNSAFADCDVVVFTWYRTYERNLGWKNRGEILGKGKTEAAYQLGASL